MPQQKSAQFDATVLQVVLAGFYRHKLFWEPFSEADLAKANALLKKYNLGHLASLAFNQISGGEQQLVWLAQIEAQDAHIIILDEPTQQLDIYNKKLVMEILANWAGEGKLVLFSTHDLYLVPRYAHQMLFFDGISSRVMEPMENNIRLITLLMENSGANRSDSY